jgi:hypothetical protein
VTLAACGSKSGSSSNSTSNAAANNGTNTATASNSGTAASTSGSAVVGSLALSVNAIGSSSANGGISPSGTDLVDAGGLELANTITWPNHDSECDPNKSGIPINANDTVNFPANSGMQGGTKIYNAAYMFCFMSEVTTGPDTLLGALSQAIGFMCAIKDQVKFDGVAHDGTINIDTSCFPQAFVTQLTSNGIPTTNIPGTITGSATSFFGNTTGKWDSSVELTTSITVSGQAQPFDMKFLISNANNVFTVAKIDAAGKDTNLNNTSGWMVSIDQANGITRYEGRFMEWDASAATIAKQSGGWNRHSRVYIKGTMGTDGTFSDVTDEEVITSNAWRSGFGEYTADNAGIKTMKGSPASGFFLKTYDGGNTNPNAWSMAAYTNSVSGCVGKSGVTCDGNTGITFTQDSDLEFLLPPKVGESTPAETSLTAGTATLDWFNALAPPTYTSVTTADTQD